MIRKMLDPSIQPNKIRNKIDEIKIFDVDLKNHIANTISNNNFDCEIDIEHHFDKGQEYFILKIYEIL